MPRRATERERLAESTFTFTNSPGNFFFTFYGIDNLFDVLPKDNWIGSGTAYLTARAKGSFRSDAGILVLELIFNRDGTVGATL